MGSTTLRLRLSSFTITLAEIPDAPSDLLAAVHPTHAYLANDKLARLDVPVVSSSSSSSRAANALPELRLRLLQQGIFSEGVCRVCVAKTLNSTGVLRLSITMMM